MHIYKPLVIMMLRILLFGWRGYCLVWNNANTSWHFKYAIEFCHSEIHSPHCRYIIEFSRNWNIQNLKKGWHAWIKFKFSLHAIQKFYEGRDRKGFEHFQTTVFNSYNLRETVSLDGWYWFFYIFKTIQNLTVIIHGIFFHFL